LKQYFLLYKEDTLREVNWTITLIMSIIFGEIGVDRFIMGHVGLGILKLLTFGGFGIWWLIDVILIATKHQFDNIKWVD
jgi:TM2 domain-containing membrane protein YozV